VAAPDAETLMAWKFLKKRGRDTDIPVASFSDLAFLLIIFFIIATTLQKTTGIITDIPAGEKTEQQEQKNPIININDRAILLNDKPVTPAELRRQLMEMDLAHKEGNDKVVMLETRGKVIYQDYFEVISSISAAGGVVALVKEEDARR
jgi:biopolymer transport protein ExbD